MNKKKIVLLFLIVIGLSVVLFFTFDYFKKEEEKMLENAHQNRLIEKEESEEKEKQKLEEEKAKQENGGKEVNALLEKLKGTKKIVLGIDDENGTLETLDLNHHYKELKTIVEETTIQEILNLFASAKWEENKNLDYKGKIWKFYNSEENLILEYDGHSFITNDKTTNIYIEKENEERLNAYFIEA